jgi:ParB family chromosome partitioning protein
MSDEKARMRLGRGLAALIGEQDIRAATAGGAPRPAAGERVVAITQIRANPANPRRQFDEDDLSDLAKSLRDHGLVQPILVRPVQGENGVRYEIIAGERRWRAAQKAGLHEVPAVVREVDDRQALELAIIENVQRSDLNPVEEALAYQQLMEEHGYTQADLGEVVAKSRSHVANTLRLLKLPKSVVEMVSRGELSAGHARTLVTADNPDALARRIVREGLSVRQAEALAQEPERPVPPKAGPRAVSASADTKALERRLADSTGLAVALRHNDAGNGELRIRYRDVEQLEEICRLLEAGR